MAKRGGGKRKHRRNVARGIAHIKATFNNTIVTITDTNGEVICWASSGTAMPSISKMGATLERPLRCMYLAAIRLSGVQPARTSDGSRCRPGSC